MVLLVACALAVAALALVAAADERELAFTPNVRPAWVVASPKPGEQACQRGLEAAAEFDAVEVLLSTGPRPGPAMSVTVEEGGGAGGRVVASGRLAAGARDNVPAAARLDREVPEGSAIDVCFRNEGARDVGIIGGHTYEGRGHATIGPHPGGGDVRIVFLRSEPRSALAQVPDVFERATRFRPDPVGAWTFWALLAGVAAGIPALLALALRRT